VSARSERNRAAEPEFTFGEAELIDVARARTRSVADAMDARVIDGGGERNR
jgi:hypothetical protein